MNEEDNLKNCQKDILLEIDRVCKKYNLTYCLAYGTCLGAIRHKGFIPWDDDIDIYMTSRDFEILKTKSDSFREPFFLQTRESDPEYGLIIGRVRNSNTTLIEECEINRDINHGVFVDIYPLYNSPKDGWKAKKLTIIAMIYRLMSYGVPPRNRGWVMKIGSAILLKITPNKLKELINYKFYKYMKEQEETGYLSPLYADAYMKFEEKVFFPVKYADFEDMVLPIPADADNYLRTIYGDYMKLPPKEKRVMHHNYKCLDFEHSYKDYKGKIYCKE